MTPLELGQMAFSIGRRQFISVLGGGNLPQDFNLAAATLVGLLVEGRTDWSGSSRPMR